MKVQRDKNTLRFKKGTYYSFKHKRKFTNFISITVKSTTDASWWWVYSKEKWMNSYEYDLTNYLRSSHFRSCHSIKAFKRRVKQWAKYMPKGTTFCLESSFTSCNAYITTK